MRITRWDDWYGVEATARQFDDEISSIHVEPTIRLWLPDPYVGSVSRELTELDLDMRRGAVLLPSRLFSPRAFPFAPLLNLPDPVRFADGRLEIQRAQISSPIDIDLAAIGLVMGLLVDAPTLFFAIRAMTRRIPFRIRLERREPSEDRVEALEVHFSDRQAELIEADRLQRRVTLSYPDGPTLVIEEYE